MLWHILGDIFFTKMEGVFLFLFSLKNILAPSTDNTLHHLYDTPLDRDRTPSAVGSSIVRPYLPLFRIHDQVLGGRFGYFYFSARERKREVRGTIGGGGGGGSVFY